MNLGTGVNKDLFLWFNHLAQRTPWLHTAAYVYAQYGVVLFALLLLIGLWTQRQASDQQLARAGWAGLATLLAVAINQPIVHAVHEPRPYATLSHILVLASRSTDPSFPSDHATMAGAATVGLLLVNRKLGSVTLVAALLICLGRVYIAAHYPLDVAAGLVLGGLVAGLGWLALRRALVALVRLLRRSRRVDRAFGRSTASPSR